MQAALVGDQYTTPQATARLETADTTRQLPDHLSERELDVLQLLALGYTNREIASELFLSIRTVETHRSHIQHKTGRTSRAQLVSYTRENGLFNRP
jgi:two-component system, NarL family, response regulator NreC